MINLNKKLAYWQNLLLDLGKRNRLINCPAPNSHKKRFSRTLISIEKPSITDLWDQFAEDNKPLVFPISKTSFDFENDDDIHKIPDNKSITNQPINETQKTLRNLMQKSKTLIEEKGLNALYLSFGYLNWHEKEKGAELRFPLLLIPVQLTQDDLFSPFILSRYDDEIVQNYALSQKLYNDFKIVLPEFTDDNNFLEYIEKIREISNAMKSSVTMETELSLFSFLKINMYNDLGNNSEKIKNHSIIRAIAGESKSITGNNINIIDYDHDAVNPQNVFCVADADSSQQDAIQLAKNGISFILQGPPGTGKSQTITNIIAELLSCGKKILFVSEKMAALEVVHKRLTSAGLNGFCLTLHSHNAKRHEVLDQLEASFKLAQKHFELRSSAYDTLAKLIQQRKQLNEYPQELHTTIEPIGDTIFNINGKIALLNDVPDIPFNPKNPETLTLYDIAELKNLLEDLSRIISESGYQIYNPWYGCIISHITNQFRKEFAIESENAVKAIDAAMLFLNNNLVNFSEANLCYNDFKNCADYITLKNELENEITHGKIKQKYTDRIFAINGEEFLTRCHTQHRSFLRIFKSKFWADHHHITRSQKITEKVTIKDMQRIAENINNIQNIENKIKQVSSLISLNSDSQIKLVAEQYDQLTAPICRFSSLFDQSKMILTRSLSEIRELITKCSGNFSDLECYIDYRDTIKMFPKSDVNIEEFIHQASQITLPANMITPAFEKCFYKAWLDAILPHYNAVKTFRGLKQDNCIKSFKEHDTSHLEISKASLISKLISRLPSLDSFTSEHDEIGMLKRELVKQRRL